MLIFPVAASAQSSFTGTGKPDVGTLETPQGRFVWLVQGGLCESRSLIPPIRVGADGHDQKVAGQPYGTSASRLLKVERIRKVAKKSGPVVSDEKLKASADTKTATDELDLCRGGNRDPIHRHYESAERGLAISSRRDRSALTPHNASTTAAPDISSAAIKYP